MNGHLKNTLLWFHADGTSFHFFVFVILMVCLLLLSGNAIAGNGDAGRIIDARGEAWVLAAQTGARVTAVNGMALNPGDTLHTGANGRLFVLCADESLIQLNSNTAFALGQVAQTAGWYGQKPFVKAAARTASSLYRLLRGEMWLRNKNRHMMIDIETSTVVVGVRGTELNLMSDGNTLSMLTVLRGKVMAANTAGRIPVTAGQQVSAIRGRPLQAVMLVSPQDAVQWTLTIPEGLLLPSYPISGPEGEELASLKEELGSGKISETYTKLTEITKEYPENASAFQLLSLSALLMGKKDEALAASRKSTTLAPKDAHGYILLSYARQAAFDLPEAARAAKDARPYP
ncbi:MAG: FecR domain-containing protein [Desulfosalsimonadaceae bacterium]|nr:FecR domain-containing protein [Desulfosalsimonadaceae bacterium]